MLGLDDYASDSDGEGETNVSPPSKPVTKPVVAQGRNASSSGLALPPPKAVKKSGTKKILVELPKLAKRVSDDEDDMEKPASKKLKLGGESGGLSSLLSMLPAPKRSTMALPPPQRVLGGGRPGIVYSASSSSNGASASVEAELEPSHSTNQQEDDEALPNTSAQSLLPPSLLLKGKGKAKQSTPSTESPNPPAPVESSKPPEVNNFFSLGSLSSSTSRTVAGPSSSSISISAAPTVEEFRPPSPTPQDEYPGYYQLPSGKWAMHDPEYYKTYTDKWKKEYEAQIRAYEKGAGMDRGFEGAAVDGAASEVNAVEQLDEARRVREERMELTKRTRIEGEPKMPKMNINPQKIGGLAGKRHQLHSLLTEAYMNREAIEEKIAQGKRNRKEAGNRYGF
ncbi:hypothetical protein SCHPADRAFT_904128 [Schizopora paradoxa]|uniref:Mitotic checkpoint regulator, MAD2B-interacting-domain-containing protein n=1 Tax=Schizopora paradoxa TaxID=27342 RepID=A0A0H2RVT4_9AGAM|nr:hypothetical protein SCHPADRAFT_904128 [Schizopora paradoxa]